MKEGDKILGAFIIGCVLGLIIMYFGLHPSKHISQYSDNCYQGEDKYGRQVICN